MYNQALHNPATQQVEHDIGSRFSACPEPAVELALTADRVSAYAEYHVATANPGLVSWRIRQHARDDQMPRESLRRTARAHRRILIP